jgi:hypothetical protein
MRIWAITDASQSDDEIISRVRDARAAIGDELCVHLRDKVRVRRDLAYRLRDLTPNLVIGDYEDLAREIGARAHGWSCSNPFSVPVHDDEEARRATSSVVLVSPIFEGKTSPRGLGAIESAKKITKASIYALGGVNVDNAGTCIRAGAHGVAVIRALFGANDSGAAADALLRAVVSFD